MKLLAAYDPYVVFALNAKYVVVVGLALVAVGCIGKAAHAAAAGEAVFKSRCANCHSLTRGLSSIAPDLTDVVGRKAGSLKDYQYSPALRDASFVWTPAKLNEWLASPHNAAPETEMAFPGLKSEKERAEVVEFLEQRHAK